MASTAIGDQAPAVGTEQAEPTAVAVATVAEPERSAGAPLGQNPAAIRSSNQNAGEGVPSATNEARSAAGSPGAGGNGTEPAGDGAEGAAESMLASEAAGDAAATFPASGDASGTAGSNGGGGNAASADKPDAECEGTAGAAGNEKRAEGERSGDGGAASQAMDQGKRLKPNEQDVGGSNEAPVRNLNFACFSRVDGDSVI